MAEATSNWLRSARNRSIFTTIRRQGFRFKIATVGLSGRPTEDACQNLTIENQFGGDNAMRADRKWVERNLGFDPITTPPPPDTFVVKRVAKGATKKSAKVTTEDFLREIIDFDSESSEGREFMAFSTSTGLSRVHRHYLAERAGAANRAEAEGQRQRTAAAR
ncbi:hypothetical protein ACVMGC_005998 [Bradyrhizobium barranii subsp. barranii]